MELGDKGDEAARCMQLGMVTWLLALLAIELALTHHAVWKVSLRHLLHLSTAEHPHSSHIVSPGHTAMSPPAVDTNVLRSASAAICRAGCQGCGNLA
jgi:hypothetical protein